MFDRTIHNVIQEGVDKFVDNPEYLRVLLSLPGWGTAEVEGQMALWADPDRRPQVVHGYARVGGRFPCFAIVLTGEQVDQEYLGQSLDGLIDTDGAAAFIEDVERALGRTIKAGVQRWRFDFSVYSYAEHPDVCLANYNVLRSIFIGSYKRLLEDGLETPTFGGQDLAPDPRYMPENLFARVWTVSAFGHVLFAQEIGLGPWAWGRGTKVGGIFVDNNVTGVKAGLTFEPAELKKP